MPELKIDDPQIRYFFKHLPPLECDKVERNWVTVENGMLKFRQDLAEKHPDFGCTYTGYSRGDDDSKAPIEHESVKFQHNFKVSLLKNTRFNDV